MTMPEPRSRAEDDELPGLPAIDGALGGDEENASDLALEDDALDDAGDEDVGLDAESGLDDDESLELDESDEDDRSWDAVEEPIEEDPELGGEDEGGWTEGSEAAEAPGWDLDLDSGAEERAARSDRGEDHGEEGVEERLERAGDDDPPEEPGSLRDRKDSTAGLGRREEELADDLELEDEAEIEALIEERVEHPALVLPELDRARVEWRWLGPEDDTIVAIGGGLAAGRRIYRVDGERAEPLSIDPLAGEAPASIAYAPGEPPLWIVGLRIGGALRSSDGRVFERLEGLRAEGALEVLAEPRVASIAWPASLASSSPDTANAARAEKNAAFSSPGTANAARTETNAAGPAFSSTDTANAARIETNAAAPAFSSTETANAASTETNAAAPAFSSTETANAASTERNARTTALASAAGRAAGLVSSTETGMPTRSPSHAKDAAGARYPRLASLGVARAGARLWALSRGGALSRSDDGRAWSGPLVAGSTHAIARAGDGGIVILGGPRRGPLQVMRSTDGGRAWRSTPGPSLPEIADETELRVVAHGPHVAIACDAPGIGPFLSNDEGRSWRVIDPLRDAVALATASEGGAIVLYAAVLCEGLDRGLVVRLPLAPAGRAEIVLDLERVRLEHHIAGAGDSEGDQRVRALAAEAIEGGTRLWIGCGLGVVRAEVRAGR